MKQIIKFATFILLTVAMIYVSCKKEHSCEGCINGNKPPIAHAGKDTIIILPVDSVILDGSTSTNDKIIVSYQWTKISGPSSFNIVNVNAVQTQATNLVEGVYQFELKVTDAEGLFSKDTVQVTVKPVVSTACDNSNRPHVNAQLIPVGTLPQIRPGMTVASAGNKILFAGGVEANTNSSRVDIYDIVTNTWSTAELGEGRREITTIAAGNKIFFGGGEIGDGTCPTNAVDIYDVSTNTWSVSALSVAGHGIAAATVGNKVFFAGGDGGFCGEPSRESKVDIYDLTTGTWSTAQLSEGRRGDISAVTANNKIYFAGGWESYNNPDPNGFQWTLSDRIDIYDNATNSWSISSLSETKNGCSGIAVADKIYWAGGGTGSYSMPPYYGYTSCVVEIKDLNTGTSSTQYLSKPAAPGQNAVLKDNKIVFPTFSDYNKFDIYDIATNTWLIGVLPQNISWATIISVNNTIYVAGAYVGVYPNGVLSNQVWKLEF